MCRMSALAATALSLSMAVSAGSALAGKPKAAPVQPQMGTTLDIRRATPEERALIVRMDPLVK